MAGQRLTGMAAAAGALLLAGCGGKPRPETTPAAPPQVMLMSQQSPTRTPAERFINAIEYLNQGQEASARSELAEVVAAEPDNGPAADLLKQIDTDAKLLLGEANWGYTVRRGDTLATIAGRLLGNRNRFWALAKYNGIAVPSALAPGTEIRIPGTPPPEPRPEPVAPPAQPAAPPAARPAAPTPPPAVAVRRDPVQAGRLRSQGLAALSRGAVDDAVNLLRRALSLDPINAVIRSDLDRAVRVQGALRRR